MAKANENKNKDNEKEMQDQFIEDLTDYMLDATDLGEEEVKDLIKQNELNLVSRADVIRLKDDGIIVVKMRFREFKKKFIEHMDKILASEDKG